MNDDPPFATVAVNFDETMKPIGQVYAILTAPNVSRVLRRRNLETTWARHSMCNIFNDQTTKIYSMCKR